MDRLVVGEDDAEIAREIARILMGFGRKIERKGGKNWQKDLLKMHKRVGELLEGVEEGEE